MRKNTLKQSILIGRLWMPTLVFAAVLAPALSQAQFSLVDRRPWQALRKEADKASPERRLQIIKQYLTAAEAEASAIQKFSFKAAKTPEAVMQKISLLPVLLQLAEEVSAMSDLTMKAAYYIVRADRIRLSAWKFMIETKPILPQVREMGIALQHACP